MSERLESVLAGTAGLSIAAAVALYLTVCRTAESSDSLARSRLVPLLVVGISAQCLHVAEEYGTGFHVRFPELLGLVPWSARFFLGFNAFWIVLWSISVFGMLANLGAAYFPLWFLAIGLVLNGVAHPLLAIASRGYFPGLITSPIVGALGWVLSLRLWELTQERVP